MRVLVVEDDAAKAEKLGQFVRSKYPGCDVTFAKSFKSGLSALVTQAYAFILLDMTLPTFDISLGEDGGIPLSFGGKEILRQMKRRGIRIPVIVTTQFERFGSGPDAMSRDELSDELKRSYSGLYEGMVYYHATQDAWRADLERTLSGMVGLNIQ